MGKYKNQHHVPEFLVSNFAGTDGLYYFDKRSPHKGIEIRNPKSVFREAHLYSYRDDKDTLQTDVESEYLKVIDTEGADVVAKIIESIRAMKLPDLSAAERDVWDKFFVTQFLRSRDRIRNGDTQSSGEEIFDEAVERLREILKNFPERVDELEQVIKNRERIIDRSVKESVKLTLDQTREVLSLRGLVFAHIVDTKSLVIGSNPLVRMNNRNRLGEMGTASLFDERTEFWLPIAKDVAVSPGSFDLSLREQALQLGNSNAQDIGRLNSYIFRHSQEIASCSHLLLKSKLLRSEYREYASIRDPKGRLIRKLPR